MIYCYRLILVTKKNGKKSKNLDSLFNGGPCPKAVASQIVDGNIDPLGDSQE
jgi:hypothetical protein